MKALRSENYGPPDALPVLVRALAAQGVYVRAGGTLPLGLLYSQKGGRRMTSMGIARVAQDDLQILAGLLENGEMLLTGKIVDQAALIGMLNKIYRLNLTIISVCETNREE